MRAQGYRETKARRTAQGEITAFLTLIFVLMVSFVGSMMESASIQMAKNYRRADMNLAIESVFAEYQKELLEEFHVFGMDASYETGTYTEDLLFHRLNYYGGSGIENEITRIQLMTDNNGQAFREQAEKYIVNKYGLEKLNGLLANAGSWETQQNEAQEFEQQEDFLEEKLQSILSQSGQQIPGEENPLSNLQSLIQRPLLELVMPKDKQISEKSLDLSEVVSQRDRQQGYGSFSDVAEERAGSTLAFGEYLLEHFSSAADEREAEGALGALEYELEYILSGESSDEENLNKVIKKLLLMRCVPNYAYIQSDTAKKAEAQAMALTICTAMLLPEITEVVTQVLLLAWAFGESLVDIRALLAGNKVPLLKSADTWQLTLSSLFSLDTAGEVQEGTDAENGLSYKEYLRMLFYLSEKTGAQAEITFRALDMLEQRLRTEKDLTWFRADACVSKIELKSRCNLRRGISYQFNTYFGYR